MLKADLRTIYKNKRKELNSSERLRMDDLLLLQFQQINFDGIQTVLSFWPIAHHAEPNTHLFSGYLRHMVPHLVLAYPVIKNATEMEAFIIDEDTVYKTNERGITEPKEGVVLSPVDIDLVLVPLLVFDEKGYRVGYGKGYYDRFLSTCSEDTLTMGFSYFDAVPLISDTHEFDIPLNLGITPQQIYEF